MEGTDFVSIRQPCLKSIGAPIHGINELTMTQEPIVPCLEQMGRVDPDEQRRRENYEGVQDSFQ